MAVQSKNIQAKKGKSIGIVDVLVQPLGRVILNMYQFDHIMSWNMFSLKDLVWNTPLRARMNTWNMLQSRLPRILPVESWNPIGKDHFLKVKLTW